MRDKIRMDWPHAERSRSTSEREMETLMTPDHTTFQLCLGSSWNWSAKPKHGMPREGSGLSCMQPIGCTQWCSTDVDAVC